MVCVSVFWLMFIGFKKFFSRILFGWGFGKRLVMVIDNFDIVWVFVLLDEIYMLLVIDLNVVLVGMVVF